MLATHTHDFNLLTAPWIPCLTPAGECRTLGIRDALTRAHALHGIRDVSPLITAALTRFLVDTLRRVLPLTSHAEWMQIWRHGAFDTVMLQTYLHDDALNLFAMSWPLSPPDAFLRDTADGTPFAIARVFDTDWAPAEQREAPAYCPACCARALTTRVALTTPTPIYLYPTGDSLFHTLLLNYLLPMYRPYGATTALAPTSAIRLLPSHDEGACARCGEYSSIRVREAQVQHAVHGVAECCVESDPWVIYWFRDDAETLSGQWQPMMPHARRETWCDLATWCLPTDIDAGCFHVIKRPRLLDQVDDLRLEGALEVTEMLEVALCAQHDATSAGWRSTRLRLPAAALGREIAPAITRALAWATRTERVLGDALCQLHPDASSSHPDWLQVCTKMSPIISSATDHFWLLLETAFRQAIIDTRLTGSPTERTDWLTTWRASVASTAWHALEIAIDTHLDRDDNAVIARHAARGVMREGLQQLDEWETE